MLIINPMINAFEMAGKIRLMSLCLLNKIIKIKPTSVAKEPTKASMIPKDLVTSLQQMLPMVNPMMLFLSKKDKD